METLLDSPWLTEVAELTASVAGASTCNNQGPTDHEGVAYALRDPAARQKAIKEYGISWLIDAKDKQLWPASALHDDDFLIQYLELKKSGMAFLPSATATADLLASANHSVSIGKAASESVPVVPYPSTAGTPFPFAAALAGRHVKVELPKPGKFSRIAVDFDIRAWLRRMHEYLTISGVEPKAWVVFASNFLAQAPLQLWEARKTQLTEQPDLLYSWDNFREWCTSSFSVHNHEKHALQQLEKLRQTGSVAEYKAAHDVLAAQTALPVQLRISWWEQGLKDEVRTMCSVDPLTHKEYTDIEKAQSAACACDAHLTSASAAAAKKHPRSSHPFSASVRVDRRPKQRPKFNDFVGKADLDPKVATWSNDSPEQFTCELDGRLQEPLPAFFQQWIDNCPRSQSTGKPLLPENLLRDGRLPSGHCYYKGCDKPGHRWNLCPRLAMHVAKNPAVRNF